MLGTRQMVGHSFPTRRSLETAMVRSVLHLCPLILFAPVPGICAPGPVGLMDILLEDNLSLREKFQKEFGACLEKKNKESCL